MGGYYPVQLSFEESRNMMREDPLRFKGLVRKSLVRQVAAINKLVARGLHFWVIRSRNFLCVLISLI
jgi:urocanate hydratase